MWPRLDVLDIGCGDGLVAIEPADSSARMTGIDPDAAMLHAAAERTASEDVHLLQGQVEALPFPDAGFDLVAAVTVLCFVKKAAMARREMGRVLRPSGRLVIGAPGAGASAHCAGAFAARSDHRSGAARQFIRPDSCAVPRRRKAR